MTKTPKQKLVASMDRPFEEVDKSERRSPLQELHPKDCDHDRAFVTDAYPVPGPTFVCADCGRITDYPEDLG